MAKKRDSSNEPKDILGVTVSREEDFSKWYTEVIRKGGFKDQRTPIKGFDVIMPWGYSLWERMSMSYDELLKEKGISNCYFPLLIPESFIEKEKEHFCGFAAETANVTEVGCEKLNEKLVIRPTSETIMYTMFSKWIRSHRDLPLKINQWCNIVRWDTKITKPFIRDREFLWSEVHTAHETYEDSNAMIDDYIDICNKFHDKLAMAPLVLKRTEHDKFPGADFSIAYDTLVQDGKVFQGPGGHYLGRNFSKPFGIKYMGHNKEKDYVWQTCLGMSTRQVGGLIMHHGDDKGAIIPPEIAPIQIVIVPIIFKDKSREVLSQAKELRKRIKKLKIRVHLDERDYSAGYKFNDWELKGVPLRIEIGPKDIKKGQFIVAKRNTGEKTELKIKKFTEVKQMLDIIQKEMLEKSKTTLRKNIRDIYTLEELKNSVNEGGFSRANLCGSLECEEYVKDQTGGASVRGTLYKEKEKTFGDCVRCGKKSKSVFYIAKAY